jgi:hypothetical protein
MTLVCRFGPPLIRRRPNTRSNPFILATQNPCAHKPLGLISADWSILTLCSYFFFTNLASGICSTHVYQLVSACAGCQNRSYLTWSRWSFFCPVSMLSAQGVYSQKIPARTRVPHWAYIKPRDHHDSFDPRAAKLVGGEFLASMCKKTSFHLLLTRTTL